jgi:hypothetical protein
MILMAIRRVPPLHPPLSLLNSGNLWAQPKSEQWQLSNVPPSSHISSIIE